VKNLFTNETNKPIGFSAIAVAIALLSLAAMVGVRVRRRMQPAMALADSSGHGIDMSIPLATVLADNTLDLKSHCPLLRIPEQFLQSLERAHAEDMHTVINSSFVHWDPLGLGEGAPKAHVKNFRESELQHGQVATIAVFFVSAAAARNANVGASAAADAPELMTQDDDGWTVTLSGLKYVDNVVGTGATAEAGKVAVVQYEGKLAESGRVFDSTKGRGAFKFIVGQGSVIPAWDEGVATMREGGKRKLYCPSRLAYGEQGAGGNGEIPANADLVFDVELEAVEDGALAVQLAQLGIGLNLRTVIAFLFVLSFILPPLFPDVAWLH
jgi:FKBP-type peptidyl-prolyl cis-trans isomerase